ncbi:hypothetical protein EI94DRAFT_1726143 [Lactarius quietus]|nr:hypothetical protein EI94DRAFT_1726143 [Lactarius quietus]
MPRTIFPTKVLLVIVLFICTSREHSLAHRCDLNRYHGAFKAIIVRNRLVAPSHRKRKTVVEPLYLLLLLCTSLGPSC